MAGEVTPGESAPGVTVSVDTSEDWVREPPADYHTDARIITVVIPTAYGHRIAHIGPEGEIMHEEEVLGY